MVKLKHLKIKNPPPLHDGIAGSKRRSGAGAGVVGRNHFPPSRGASRDSNNQYPFPQSVPVKKNFFVSGVSSLPPVDKTSDRLTNTPPFRVKKDREFGVRDNRNSLGNLHATQSPPPFSNMDGNRRKMAGRLP